MSEHPWRRVFEDNGWFDPERRRELPDVQLELKGGHKEPLHYVMRVAPDYFVVQYRDRNRAYYLWSSIVRITERHLPDEAIAHEHEP